MASSKRQPLANKSKGLPADFTYPRRTFSTKNENVDADERTEVSVITSDAVDRDNPADRVRTPQGRLRAANDLDP